MGVPGHPGAPGQSPRQSPRLGAVPPPPFAAAEPLGSRSGPSSTPLAMQPPPSDRGVPAPSLHPAGGLGMSEGGGHAPHGEAADGPADADDGGYAVRPERDSGYAVNPEDGGHAAADPEAGGYSADPEGGGYPAADPEAGGYAADPEGGGSAAADPVGALGFITGYAAGPEQAARDAAADAGTGCWDADAGGEAEIANAAAAAAEESVQEYTVRFCKQQHACRFWSRCSPDAELDALRSPTVSARF